MSKVQQAITEYNEKVDDQANRAEDALVEKIKQEGPGTSVRFYEQLLPGAIVELNNRSIAVKMWSEESYGDPWPNPEPTDEGHHELSVLKK